VYAKSIFAGKIAGSGHEPAKTSGQSFFFAGSNRILGYEPAILFLCFVKSNVHISI
jgi:hypothetical protein